MSTLPAILLQIIQDYIRLTTKDLVLEFEKRIAQYDKKILRPPSLKAESVDIKASRLAVSNTEKAHNCEWIINTFT